MDLNVVSDDHWPRLRDLLPRAIVALGKTEPVAANHGAILENDAVANSAAFPDNRVRMGKEILANPDSWVNDGMGQQCCPVSEYNSSSYNDICSDMGISSNDSGGVDHGARMNGRWVDWRAVKDSDRAGERQIRVWGADSCDPEFGKIRSNEDRGGFGRLRKGSVFAVRDEGQLPGTSILDPCNSRDFNVGWPAAFGAKFSG